MTQPVFLNGQSTLVAGVFGNNASNPTSKTETINLFIAGIPNSPGTQTVNKTVKTTTLASSLNPSLFGNTVMFTATVTPISAGGTVTFMDGATALGTGTLSGGLATFSTTTLAVASHTVTAVYGGDTNDATSADSGGQQGDGYRDAGEPDADV